MGILGVFRVFSGCAGRGVFGCFRGILGYFGISSCVIGLGVGCFGVFWVLNLGYWDFWGVLSSLLHFWDTFGFLGCFLSLGFWCFGLGLSLGWV